jgi:outer membrane protein OmpA-like peptidoglycan-associated protein
MVTGTLIRRSLVGALALAGSACTTVLAPERTPAIGPPFNEALKDRYLELAATTWDGGSWHFLHFRDKATAAMHGAEVLPDRVTWVPPEAQRELEGERAHLLLLLDSGAWQLAPEEAAAAQVGFDCWLADVQATGRLDSACRETFESALARTEQILIAQVPADYVVQFESGSDMVGGQGLNVATAVARAVPLLEPARIEVTGYADRSGAAAGNAALSRARADNVAAALQRAGVAPALINVQSGGTAGGGETGRRVEVALRS